MTAVATEIERGDALAVRGNRLAIDDAGPRAQACPTLRRSVMTFGAFISRVSGALVAGSLAFTLIFAAVHAAEDQRKVTVVSFGLFGGQGVFRRKATGAAEIVANRFGADQVVTKLRVLEHRIPSP
jgi:hypothetical protein